MSLSISLTSSAEDIEAVRDLCREFVSWQLANFPERRSSIQAYFGSAAWEKTLEDLPRIHARPRGAIHLARRDNRPVGCISYQPIDKASAEVKRLFVTPDARGTGIGAALVAAMIGQARADGYSVLRLDTAAFLTTARTLYRKHGFEEVAPPEDLPEDQRSVAIFMRRSL